MEPTHSTQSTLVLSQGYEPVTIVSWQRAITLLFLGKVEIVESYDRHIKTTSLVIKVPAVVRLLNAIRRHKKPVKFSRINVYARDSYRCQYCGVRKAIGELTYDHVVPRAQGGKTTWTNVCACCDDCNRKKGNKTPDQAGMRLLSIPACPVAAPVMVLELGRRQVPEVWEGYFSYLRRSDGME